MQTRTVPTLLLAMLLWLRSFALEARQSSLLFMGVMSSTASDVSLLETEEAIMLAPVCTDSWSWRDIDHRRSGQTEARSIHDSDCRGNAGHAGAVLRTWRCKMVHSWH
mmetsp:Transcript_51062/g.119494  ORF Transcript_51062/g.119494 Transcript_51062/m.119494 type:complete len:108 (-) Transcript_51062:477-800(-)